MSEQNFIKVAEGFFADGDYTQQLAEIGLDCIDAVFAFEGDRNLAKPNLAEHRTRIQFTLGAAGGVCFLKRYDSPPPFGQMRNWLDHLRRASTAAYDRLPTTQLNAAGIKTAKVIAYGEQWAGLFEKRSFVITEKIPDADSLEQRLPEYFYGSCPLENVDRKRRFIAKLADFARRFHETGLRHRDFYLCHIFMSAGEEFYLIDLQRTFKPVVFDKRFRIKDIAQLYYSAPGDVISRADRLRFYRRYTGRKKLTRSDRFFLGRLKARAWRMAEHDIKHGRDVPFAI